LKQTPKMDRKSTQLPLAAPRMRIGLLGGSFNPPHAAHRQISLTALKRLGLDQVWWLVSPANPLKDTSGLPSLEQRVGAAQEIADHPRIAVTGFAGNGKSLYIVDVLTALKRRYPGVNFVWLMGADNLADIHRWQAWQTIFGLMPIAVLDRPGYRLKARANQAAQRFADFHVDESDAAGLALLTAPAWTVITHPLSGLSSTALRAKAQPAKKKKPKFKAKAKAKAVRTAKTPEQKAKIKAAAAKREKAAKRAKKAAAKAGKKPQVKKPAAKTGKKSPVKKAVAKPASKRNQGKKKPKRR
jgi:nicotinate-nucleotide adenylyltransferase